MPPVPTTVTTTHAAAVLATLPPVIFGTSALGNLYRAMPEAQGRELIAACAGATGPLVLDSAGKYGAGLALESVGRHLRTLGIAPERVLISNKLGWRRSPLVGAEPTFEPGAWVDLTHDAVQDISADGIGRCWEEGCRLLGAPYQPQLVSVHDPDEYLAAATGSGDRTRRFDDIAGAYAALHALKRARQCVAVGIGAKDWRVLREVCARVDLDWVMLACSLTVYHHPPELIAFIAELRRAGIAVINSAVFHAGFLTGGEHFDYRRMDRANHGDAPLFAWRQRFHDACAAFAVDPAAACVRFGAAVPGVVATALNTSHPQRVAGNVALASAHIPAGFWRRLQDDGLVRRDLPWLAC